MLLAPAADIVDYMAVDDDGDVKVTMAEERRVVIRNSSEERYRKVRRRGLETDRPAVNVLLGAGLGKDNEAGWVSEDVSKRLLIEGWATNG